MFAARLLARLALVCLALEVVACKKRTPVAGAAVSGATTRSTVMKADGVGTFDLALAADGPLVLRVRGRGLLAYGLTPSGATRTPDRVVYTTQTEITEVRALGVGARVAVAFIERSGDDGRLVAIWLDRDGNVVEPKRELGPSTLAAFGSRGNLALAARGDAALLFARGADEACSGPTQRCARFSFYQLDRPGPAELRRPPLSVPNPCPVNTALFAVTDNRWYYAVCNEVGASWKTTAFLIQSEPQYARADEAFSDCTPIGAAIVDRNLVVTGDCDGTRRAIELEAIEADPLRFTIPEGAVQCRGGHPVLHLESTLVSLDAPRADVAALLPASLLPRDARALWTGSTLVIAQYRSREIALASYACADDALKPAPPHG